MLNWKLILQLSLFGLAMALTTLTLIPSNIEPVCWLVIFIVCALIIAKKCSGKYFLHGFLVSMVNSIWITAAHVAFYGTYMDSHPEMNALPTHGHPRLMMILMGLLFGVAFGIVLGLFSFVAGKAIKKSGSKTNEPNKF